LHSVAVFIDRSNILVRALTYFYLFIVLAAYAVLILQEDSYFKAVYVVPFIVLTDGVVLMLYCCCTDAALRFVNFS
jgi:hypothetical protein